MKQSNGLGTIIVSFSITALLLGALLATVGCGDLADFGATGETTQSACKAGSKQVSEARASGNVIVSADGDVVYITHFDARYGCDAKVAMEAVRLGDQILVYEEVLNPGQSGKCSCTYDLTVPVHDIPEGTYLVRVYNDLDKLVGSDSVTVGMLGRGVSKEVNNEALIDDLKPPKANDGKVVDVATRPPAQDERASACSGWRISSVAVEKWANGNVKNAMRVQGSFPINMPGVTERPNWYINGYALGKASVFFTMCTIYGGPYLNDNAKNTVTFKFSNAPCAGFSQTYTFDYSSSKVANGGQKWF